MNSARQDVNELLVPIRKLVSTTPTAVLCKPNQDVVSLRQNQTIGDALLVSGIPGGWNGGPTLGVGLCMWRAVQPPCQGRHARLHRRVLVLGWQCAGLMHFRRTSPPLHADVGQAGNPQRAHCGGARLG